MSWEVTLTNTRREIDQQALIGLSRVGTSWHIHVGVYIVYTHVFNRLFTILAMYDTHLIMLQGFDHVRRFQLLSTHVGSCDRFRIGAINHQGH